MNATIEYRDPTTLRNHPLNLKIYGDTPDPEFVESVRTNGVTTPLQILDDGTVIEGHRRKQSSVIIGLKTVPVIVRSDLTDPLHIERTLILGNRYREKTTEQKAREYERLKEIEAELAAVREAATQFKADDSTGVPNVAPPEKQAENSKRGKSRKIAAEAVGMGHTSAEKAVEVVHAIDEAIADGDVETATALSVTLNKSVAAAHRQVKAKLSKDEALAEIRKVNSKAAADILSGALELKNKDVIALGMSDNIAAGIRNLRADRAWDDDGKAPPAEPTPTVEKPVEQEVVRDDLKRPAPAHLRNVFDGLAAFKSLNKELGALRNKAKELCDHPGGIEFRTQWQTFEAHIKNAQSTLKFSTPLTECPRCKGKPKETCDVCRGYGFIVKGQDGRLTDADRTWLDA